MYLYVDEKKIVKKNTCTMFQEILHNEKFKVLLIYRSKL